MAPITRPELITVEFEKVTKRLPDETLASMIDIPVAPVAPTTMPAFKVDVSDLVTIRLPVVTLTAVTCSPVAPVAPNTPVLTNDQLV